MIIIFIGPHGCGKGTQSKILSEKLNITHISTGDIFRNLSFAELKEKIDAIINKGNLVPDDITLNILGNRISKEDCEKCFILDGFPRNLNQAMLLEKVCPVDFVVNIYVPDEESIRRISGRRVCPKCKFNFNVYTEPKPKKEGFCDFCNVSLIRREDDSEESVKKRLLIYHKETKPILEFYNKKVFTINDIGKIGEVSKRIFLL